MKVENAVYPTPDQLQAVSTQTAEGPLVMVNLLKFREKAVYKDGRPDDITGAEAYMRYAEQMRGVVEREGGRFLFGGEVQGLVIGEVEELWDIVVSWNIRHAKTLFASSRCLKYKRPGCTAKLVWPVSC